MRRMLPLLLGALLMGATAATAVVQGKDWGAIPPHGHVMLLGAEIDGGQLFFRRCVEFAAGEPLPNTGHHASVHVGAASGSPFVQGALWDAGHVVAPLSPLTPWTGCESLTSGMAFP